MPKTLDAVVVGGGHNGLVAAAYLAGRGLGSWAAAPRPPRRRRDGRFGTTPRADPARPAPLTVARREAVVQIRSSPTISVAGRLSYQAALAAERRSMGGG
jgi:hypothetical protein